MINNNQHCPVCGDTNLCAIALEPQANDCWCFHSTIKPELIAEAGQQHLPAQQKSCLCQRCAERALKLCTELKEPL